MRTISRLTTAVITTTLLLGGLAAVAPSASADDYDPTQGVRMNNPKGGPWHQYEIQRELVRSIYSAPRGTRIRIASWNIRSHTIAKALVRAHRRGVTVQVLMDRVNASAHEVDPNNPIPASGDPNPDWDWMKREFRLNNDRRPGYRSWARTCVRSCRGRSGLPHIKMAIFDQVHRTHHVVIYTSANLTGAGVHAQWNDSYTRIGDTVFYWAMHRFNEMSRDRALKNPWQVASVGAGLRIGAFPWYGARTVGDPIGRVLNMVTCTGATGNAGNRYGHTMIRINQTALDDPRGVNIAKKLKHLWNSGCDIKILYALMGPKVRAVLASRSGRGPVPMQQMAQDTNGDFVYDRYLHQKVMTISGNWAGDTSANYTWNGSANMAGYTLASDEIFARIHGRGVLLAYNAFNRYWFSHPLQSARGRINPKLRARGRDRPVREDGPELSALPARPVLPGSGIRAGAAPVPG